MPEQDNHLRMMRAVRFRHMRRDRLDVRMPSHRLIDPDLVPVLFLPRAMHELDLDRLAHIVIELAPSFCIRSNPVRAPQANEMWFLQKEIDIKEIVEQPTLRYEGVSEDISQTDRVYIACSGQFGDVVQLDGGWDEGFTFGR